jgi:multiple sugar transport system substrate-binding protein
MNPNAENKEAAWDVMRYLATEGSWHNVAFGRLPAWNEFDADEVAEEFLGDSAGELIDAESFAKYQLPPDPSFPIDTIFVAAPEIDQITSEEYEKALLGEISLDEALENMKRRADQAIRSARTREQ